MTFSALTPTPSQVSIKEWKSRRKATTPKADDRGETLQLSAYSPEAWSAKLHGGVSAGAFLDGKQQTQKSKMTEIYAVGVGAQEDFLFATRELAVQSIKLTWHRVAKVVPNALLTQCTLVWNDELTPNTIVPITPRHVWHIVTHM